MILTATPYRISLFGGGTDYPEYFEECGGGAVLGMAIDKFCYVGVKRMPPGQVMKRLLPSGSFEDVPLRYRVQYSKVNDCLEVGEIQHPAVRGALVYYGIDEPLEFHVFGDLPGNSGLGGSSAFTVGLVHALRSLIPLPALEPLDAWGIAEDAIYIEREVIREAVGHQDQVLCAHGGLKLVSFEKDRRRILSLDLRAGRIMELEYSLVLVFSGTMRHAHVMAGKQIAQIPNKRSVLSQMVRLAKAGADLLADDEIPLDGIGSMLAHSWTLKKQLCPEVSTPSIDELYERGLKAGASGGKLLGAGGGGFMLFYVPVHRVEEFEKNLGLPVHRFRISPKGTHIVIGE